MWNRGEAEVSCRSHQTEMNSTFQSGNIRQKLCDEETQEVGRRGGGTEIMSANETQKNYVAWHCALTNHSVKSRNPILSL